MKNRKLAEVGDKIMKGEHPEETMNIEDALWIISLALGLGKSQYRCVSFHIKRSSSGHWLGDGHRIFEF